MPETPAAIYDNLCGHARETALLEATNALLEWDDRTKIPSAAALPIPSTRPFRTMRKLSGSCLLYLRET